MGSRCVASKAMESRVDKEFMNTLYFQRPFQVVLICNRQVCVHRRLLGMLDRNGLWSGRVLSASYSPGLSDSGDLAHLSLR